MIGGKGERKGDRRTEELKRIVEILFQHVAPEHNISGQIYHTFGIDIFRT